jgi:hypothetical protein
VAYPIKGTPYFDRVASRVASPVPWEHGSDRDSIVEGRHSRSFYRHATRWMLSEVALEAERHRLPRPRYRRMARAYLGSAAGRLGMRATRHRRDGAAP